MPQGANGAYNWRRHEKIILGFASAIGWAPLSWVFFMVVFMFLSAVLPRSFPLMEVLFFIHVIVFGILAGFCPNFFVLPAWILNFLSFVLSVKQVVTSIVDPFEANGFYHPDSGYARYHSFSVHNVYLAVLALFFLIVLYRPALFYLRRLAGWRFGRDKGEG